MLQALGGPVPPNTDHAVSVSLPTWQANIGYEEGQDWVISKMQCGYPRFFVHPSIQRLAEEVIRRHGDVEVDSATLFPTKKTAQVCYSFMTSKIPHEDVAKVRILNFVPARGADPTSLVSSLSCVLYPKQYASVAKQVWQHSGNGISSRRSEFLLTALQDGYLVEEHSPNAPEKPRRLHKGPRRYQTKDSFDATSTKEPGSPPPTNGVREGREYAQFIEERFGRNLNLSLADRAKLAVRRRIAGSLTADVDLSEALEKSPSDGRVAGLSEDDVFLYPSGMSSIFNVHQILLHTLGEKKSICFGFPYIDTLKILEKWGPGCLFYGHGSSEDLDDIEKRLRGGERVLALFTEFPGNPLLKSADLRRIRALADEFKFAVVVDETVGNFINVNVLPYADVVVSSLTKIFSGDSNVMGGSAVLNPHGPFYRDLKDTFEAEYEDLVWAEDAVFLERNSRDFISRIEKINTTTEAVTDLLKASPIVKEVYYPKYSPTKPLYDSFKNPRGGYGGLFSVTFHSTAEAVAFFDTLEVMKGPSLGTNFTLSCPYTLIAHYGELEWARSFDVDPDLVRISVGLEDTADLSGRFQRALAAAKDAATQA
ncbi:Cystathionine gamma-synthase [Paecilomyces lecythidis]|uniref:Cystathionine gamma-synthase n=1 Tax=Paecilomyces lecythidis TaxID=3004212 RepID=A0ABR3WSV2_9EURO